MKDFGKTEGQLLDELMELRQKIAELEAAQAARKALENSYREKERKLFTLVSNLPGIAYRCLNDPQWTMEFISEGCLYLTGYSAEDLIYNRIVSYSELIHPEDRQQVWENVQNAVSKHLPFQIVYRLVAANGKIKTVWEQGLGIYNEAGELISLEGFVTDVTQLKKVEEALEQRTEELESLIQMVAHDLKSPIVTIVGLIKFLNTRIKHNDFNDTARQVFDQIAIAGDAVEKFLRDLLDGLAIDHVTPERRPLYLDQVVRAVVAQHAGLASNCGIEITFKSECASPSVIADERRISQVIDNLIVNAIKHMGNRQAQEIRLLVREEGPLLITTVEDNGIGIPHEYQSRIFERFFRIPKSGKLGGTGLGLYIVKKLVQKEGGEIWVESHEGGGAKFHFSLPRFVPTSDVQAIV